MAAYYTCAALALPALDAIAHRRATPGSRCCWRSPARRSRIPGIIWALTLVPGVVVALLPRHGPKLVAVGLARHARSRWPCSRRRIPVVFSYRLHLDFDPAWRALGETQFLLSNWHLLWYGGIVAALLAWRQLAAPDLAPLTAIMATGGLFLVVVFGFTNARAVGDRADDDQPRDAAPRAARRGVRRARVSRLCRSAGLQRRRPLRRRRRRRLAAARPHGASACCSCRRVTLVCVDTANHALALRALAKSQEDTRYRARAVPDRCACPRDLAAPRRRRGASRIARSTRATRIRS